MESKVKKLLDACTEKIEMCSFWNFVIWSFTNNFKELQDIPFFDDVGESDLKRFIKICDNRLDRAKTFQRDVSIVLGFDLTALSILAVMTKDNMFINILPHSGIVTFAFLFIILIFLLRLLAHYRSHIHAWTAFKEKALM